jgi:Glycosyltransferase Family 4
MRSTSILFTNSALASRGGTETYLRDVALALLRRGHRPIAFSLVLGRTADELRRATVPVVDDLSRLGSPPDVIHGHHHLETLIAALTFPDTPIVHFCHGWVPWEELPLRHPSIARYVGVDEVCLDRLVQEEGIAPDRVDVLHNFVDLDRFRPRPSLPPTPRRALVLSNYATADGYARIIGGACADAGIALDIVGEAHGNPTDAPEALLQEYDLVFAKGRTALEALTVGCAVILADAAGSGPLVTSANVDRLRTRNFGIRELQNPHATAWYAREIAAYAANDAACVSARTRTNAGLEPAIDRLLAIYAAAMTGHRETAGASQATARHLARIALRLKSAYTLSILSRDLARDLELARAERDGEILARGEESTRAERDGREHRMTLDRLRSRLEVVERDLAAARKRERSLETGLEHHRARLRSVEGELGSERDRADRLEADVAAFRSLSTLRLRDALLQVPLLGSMLHAGARRCAHALDRFRATAR